MTEPTRYFPERFKAASRFYTAGRPTYPKLLSRRVASLVGIGQQDAVLDLGTGPGFLALDFAAVSKNVTAVDPAEEMLALARENAARAGVQIRVVRGASYELGPELGRFKLVTIGRAFHWMDRVETLKVLDGLVERTGAVALFGESYPEVPANAWHQEFSSDRRQLLDGRSGAFANTAEPQERSRAARLSLRAPRARRRARAPSHADRALRRPRVVFCVDLGRPPRVARRRLSPRNPRRRQQAR